MNFTEYTKQTALDNATAQTPLLRHLKGLDGKNTPQTQLAEFLPDDFLVWIAGKFHDGAGLAAVGAELGVSAAAVSQWMNRRTKPSRTVLKLAWLLANVRDPGDVDPFS